MPLVLPQPCSPVRVIRIPTQPKTTGDHIRKRRLMLKMTQAEVAKEIGVCEPSVFLWEANTVNPEIRYMPAVIRFLGYNPLPEANTMPEQLVRRRTTLRGSSQKRCGASEIGVDPGTLARWETREARARPVRISKACSDSWLIEISSPPYGAPGSYGRLELRAPE